jgi:hypothetical protein
LPLSLIIVRKQKERGLEQTMPHLANEADLADVRRINHLTILKKRK